MQKYGFVYIWYDRKHKRFYIGCHWGTEDDGYICSSNWMRDAYRRRPEDFGKRKTIVKIFTNMGDLLEEEFKWLSLIKDEELGKRYYNLSKKHFGHWSIDEDKKLSVAEKCRIGNTGKKYSEEVNKKKGRKGRVSGMKGKHHTNEAKQKTSKALKGIKKGPMSEEIKLKVSLGRKGKPAWNKGLSKATDDRVRKQSISLIGHPNYNIDCINQYSGEL